MKRWIVVAAALVAACSSQTAREAVSGASPSSGPLLATFQGEAVPVAGRFIVSSTPVTVGLPGDASLAPIPEPGGVTVQTVPGTYWATGYPYTGPSLGECGVDEASWGGAVTVTNGFGSTSYLSGVYARISYAAPSVSMPTCGSTAAPSGLSSSMGVWSYGLVAGTAPSAQQIWAFKWDPSQTGFKFFGEVYGAKVTAATLPATAPAKGSAQSSGSKIVYPFYTSPTNRGLAFIDSIGNVTKSAGTFGDYPVAIAPDGGNRIWWLGLYGRAGISDATGSLSSDVEIGVAGAEVGFGITLVPNDVDKAWLLTSTKGNGPPGGEYAGAIRSMNSSFNIVGPYVFTGMPGGLAAAVVDGKTKLFVTNTADPLGTPTSTVIIWDTTTPWTTRTEVDVGSVIGCNGPGPIILGPDSNLWFIATNAVCKITPAGVASKVLTVSAPTNLCVGPSGSIWYMSPTALVRFYASAAVEATPWVMTMLSDLGGSDPVSCAYGDTAGLWAVSGSGGNNAYLHFELAAP